MVFVAWVWPQRKYLVWGYASPPGPEGKTMVAFPLVLPMGWVESPPQFCAVTETVADLANTVLR